MVKGSENEDKIKHSVFMITINTNKNLAKKYVKNNAEKLLGVQDKYTQSDDVQKFNRSIKFIFTAPKVYEYIIEKRPGHTFDPKKIIKYGWKYSIEQGKKFGKIHAHIMMKIDHKMFIGINQEKIRTFYKNMFGTSIHLNIQARGNALKSWEDYIFKDSDENPTKEAKIKIVDEDTEEKK